MSATSDPAKADTLPTPATWQPTLNRDQATVFQGAVASFMAGILDLAVAGIDDEGARIDAAASYVLSAQMLHDVCEFLGDPSPPVSVLGDFAAMIAAGEMPAIASDAAFDQLHDVVRTDGAS